MRSDGTFAPAHALFDGRLERSGRATKQVRTHSHTHRVELLPYLSGSDYGVASPLLLAVKDTCLHASKVGVVAHSYTADASVALPAASQ